MRFFLHFGQGGKVFCLCESLLGIGSDRVHLFDQVIVAPFKIGNASLCHIQGLFGLLASLFERGHFLTALNDGHQRDSNVCEEGLILRAP